MRIPLLVTAAVALTLLPGTGSVGLFDPWETHYAEVARNMLRSGDWISPWWGSDWPAGEACRAIEDCPDGWECRAIRADYLDRPPTCRPADVPREGRYFFSKPALPFWLMAIGMALLGVGPLGVRLPFVLLALLGVFELSRAATRLFGRRVGALAGLALGAAPLYALVGRQALTDGPFVALLAAGCGRLMTALWAEAGARHDRRAYAGFVALFGAAVVPQALLVGLELRVSADLLGMRIPLGPVHALVWLGAAAAVVVRDLRHKPGARERDLRLGFLFLGLALLSKGVLAWALPGAAALLYMGVARDRGLLARLDLGRGVVVAAAVGAPWYAAMFARHHPGFFERFFVHDHLQRLASGVHAVEGGGFEHYALWLGVGLFPWVALLPAALVREARGRPEGARLFCGIWLLTTMAVFTLAQTKYHHYILPAAPPAAVLIALLIDDLAAGRLGRSTGWLAAASAVCALGVLGADLAGDPRRVINLATYMYDREWPPGLGLGSELAALAAVAVAAVAAPVALGRPRALPAAVAVAGLLAGGWTVQRYVPTIEGTWSQRALFEAYHADCTPATPAEELASGRLRCEEPLIAYRMFWRGETWHSGNTVIPLRKPPQIRHFLASPEAEGPYYVLTERRRVDSQLVHELPEGRRGGLRTVHDDNAKFILLHVPAGGR